MSALAEGGVIVFSHALHRQCFDKNQAMAILAIANPSLFAPVGLDRSPDFPRSTIRTADWKQLRTSISGTAFYAAT
jgi:hypothetical protein